uniref:Uncharacterized protein n=1 Tax=Parascaris equorum TaxID=6256 RepID=A0A914SEA9_PAREQ
MSLLSKSSHTLDKWAWNNRFQLHDMPFPKEDAVAVTQIAIDSSGPELLYYDWKKRDIYARMLSADHRFKERKWTCKSGAHFCLRVSSVATKPFCAAGYGYNNERNDCEGTKFGAQLPRPFRSDSEVKNIYISNFYLSSISNKNLLFLPCFEKQRIPFERIVCSKVISTFF